MIAARTRSEARFAKQPELNDPVSLAEGQASRIYHHEKRLR